MSHQDSNRDVKLLKVIQNLIGVVVVLIAGIIIILFISIFHWDMKSLFTRSNNESVQELEKKRSFLKWKSENNVADEMATFWAPASFDEMPKDSEAKARIEYGKELIAHTAKYLGPNGSVRKISNGMNCQNCHLDAGTKVWGNNYGAVFSTYPKYRARSGMEEDITKRINDCLERSLNGKALPIDSREMQSMKAYIEFIGKDVKKGVKPKGSGIFELKFLERAADPTRGKVVFVNKCQSCHQANGEGLLTENKVEYIYPPLWGPHSYNNGAGLYRISRFAGYVKYNMPQGASFQNSQLSDEECWDVAAFVNSQSRPVKNIKADWPKIAEKPIDHPFGPFADAFSEAQHKFGPFSPIVSERKRQKEIKDTIKI